MRETPRCFDEMMTVLARVRSRSRRRDAQLPAHRRRESTKTRDPAVAGLDSLLRGVLKFSGYRLLGTSVATASEGESGDADVDRPAPTATSLSRRRERSCSGEGADASVHLVVELWRVDADSDRAAW